MRVAVRSNKFKRDVKRAEKRRKDMDKLREILSLLIDDLPLAPAYRDHALKGEWEGYRDLHIEPDWLLIYAVQNDELHLARTGTHADLFEN